MVRQSNMALVRDAVQRMNGWFSVTDIALRCQTLSRSTVTAALKELVWKGELRQQLVSRIVVYTRK